MVRASFSATHISGRKFPVAVRKLQINQERIMCEPAVINLPAVNIGRPEPGENTPYYDRYISLVAGADILGTLEAQRRQMLLLLSGRDEAGGDFRYAPDKWSAKEVLGHVCDTERIFAYRALRISRGDRTPMEGFEQDDYVRNGPFARIALPEIIEDYIAVRRATLTVLRNLNEADWTRRGIANKNEVTVRALAYIIAGHELHHRSILEEKYFNIS
jgi:DinB superfamily